VPYIGQKRGLDFQVPSGDAQVSASHRGAATLRLQAGDAKVRVPSLPVGQFGLALSWSVEWSTVSSYNLQVGG